MPHMPHNPHTDKYRDIKLSMSDRDTIAHATHATQSLPQKSKFCKTTLLNRIVLQNFVIYCYYNSRSFRAIKINSSIVASGFDINLTYCKIPLIRICVKSVETNARRKSIPNSDVVGIVSRF